VSIREFKSFSEFGLFLSAAMVEQVVDIHEGLEKAAKYIEEVAKGEFGEYQQSAGEFEAWQPLADSTMDDRLRKGFTPDDPLLRTGDVRDSIEHQVEGLQAEIGSNSEKLMWLELGTEKMPPRSTLGIAAVRSEPKILSILGAYTAKALLGNYTEIKSLEMVHDG